MIPSGCFRLIVEPVLIVNTDHPHGGNQDQEDVEENEDCDGITSTDALLVLASLGLGCDQHCDCNFFLITDALPSSPIYE